MNNQSEPSVGVALVKLVCPICGNIVREDIVMNTLLTANMAKRVESLDKESFIADCACEECEKLKDQALFIVELLEAPGKGSIVKSGRYAGIKKDCALAKMIKDTGQVIALNDGVTMVFIEKGTLELWE